MCVTAKFNDIMDSITRALDVAVTAIETLHSDMELLESFRSVQSLPERNPGRACTVIFTRRTCRERRVVEAPKRRRNVFRHNACG